MKAKSDTVRAVLVGCGAISSAWLQASRALGNLEIVGLVDLREKAARKRAREFGLARAVLGTDLREVLKRTSPDAVFDCTVPEAHKQVTLTALRHGCHVLGEKPMATTLADARQMVRAALQARRIYAVTQTRRYDARIRRLARFLQSGTLGRLTMMHSDFFIGAHFGGFRDRMKHVLLLDMAIHTFDSARLLSGADPVAVYCRDWNPVGSWYRHGAAAVAVFEMSGGLVYTYRGSWCAQGLNTSWECSWHVVGERGGVRWDGADDYRAQVVAEPVGFIWKFRDVEVPPFDAGEKVGGHAGAIREFVRCVQSGQTPEIVCTDNIKSLAMVLAAVRSAETGRRVLVRW